MKTASWFNAGSMAGRVGISLGVPRRGVIGGYRLFRQLAPTREMLQWPRQAYEGRFFAMLGEMSPRKVWDQLHEMTGGNEPVLMCFENPPFTEANWCHRRMVAQWFEATLGERVPELNYEGPDLRLYVSPRVGRDL